MHQGSRCDRCRELALHLAAVAAICLPSGCASQRALQPGAPAAPETPAARSSPAIGQSSSGPASCSRRRLERQHGTVSSPRVPSRLPALWGSLDPAFPNLFAHDEDSFLGPPAHCPLGAALPLQPELLPPAGGEASDLVAEDALSCDDLPPDVHESLLFRVGHDHLNYYSGRSVLLLGAAVGAAALMAHTALDDDVYAKVHWSIWHDGKRDWAKRLHPTRRLGDGKYTLPVFAGAWLAGGLLGEAPFADVVGDWGERSLRTVLVGAPPVLLMQRVIGASRPAESDSGSRWRPFHDSNGVSGHAFMGAVPFLCAAKMSDEMPFKAAFYAASLVPSVQRIAGEKHYLSQVLLGWTMAYAAAAAVDRTQCADRNVSVLPLIGDDEVGAAVEYRW
jgi:hypothetical protein